MLSYSALAVTRTDADAYHQDRANADWGSATTGARDAALRRGQDFIAREYNTRWTSVFDNSDVPVEVKLAIYEAALMELRKPGTFSPTTTGQDAKMLVGVGSLRWERLGETKGSEALLPTIRHIDNLLMPVTSANVMAIGTVV